MAPPRRPQKRRQQKKPPHRFRISPSTTPVQLWAVNLVSPNAQDVQVPQWYLKAAEKAETRDKEKTRGTGSRKNIKRQLDNQPLTNKRTNTRYNLRSAPQPQSPAEPDPMPNRNPKRPGPEPEDVSQSDQASTIRATAQDQFMSITATRSRQTLTSTVERRSGIQRLLNLNHAKPQFFDDYSLEQCPKSVQDLCVRLRKEAFCYEGVIPGELRSLIMRDYPLEQPPDAIWGPSSTTSEEENEASALYRRVQKLYRAMMDHNTINLGVEEAILYGDIKKALAHFTSISQPPNMQEGDESGLNFRNLTPISCTSHAISNELLPYDYITGRRIKSAKVDFLVGYSRPWGNKPWADLLVNRADQGGELVALTPLQGMENNFMGVIPIEVKSAAGDPIDARYQLTLCANGMLRLRQRWAASGGSAGQQKKRFDPENPPVVIALSIVGHHWTYYVIFLGNPQKGGERMPPPMARTPRLSRFHPQDSHNHDSIPRIVMGPFMAGHTMGILPTFQLFHFLTVLREWVVNEWAPVVYEELSVPPPAGSTCSESLEASKSV